MGWQLNMFFSDQLKTFTILLSFVLILHLPGQVIASTAKSKQEATVSLNEDSTVKAVIMKVLMSKAETQVFHYPGSLERFYRQSDFKPIWITHERDVSKTWEALIMLDCVLQFGLNHADYHPNKLLYSTVQDIIDKPSNVNPIEIAWFDMLLSDALISFMNHLHFGKFNPVYTNDIVDKGGIPGFYAEDILRAAIQQSDFKAMVLNVQPKARQYVLMQEYMRLVKGQYVGDCYETPEGVIRKLAINMERLRWADIIEDSFIQVNIPSYTLKLQVPDSTYLFKIIVGKPMNPTPVLQSSITHFTTAPDWKVPRKIFIKEILPKAMKTPGYLENNHFAIYDAKGNYISPVNHSLMIVKKNPDKYFMRQSAGCDNALGLVVFRFQNNSDIYIHDTPDQELFNRKVRALSHGCIRVQFAEKLASILLDLDGQKQVVKVLHQAMINYQPKNFLLKTNVPLKITYLTCEVNEFGVVEYDDIYKQDDALEIAFYGGLSTIK